jgi:hypothetical protein
MSKNPTCFSACAYLYLRVPEDEALEPNHAGLYKTSVHFVILSHALVINFD